MARLVQKGGMAMQYPLLERMIVWARFEMPGAMAKLEFSGWQIEGRRMFMERKDLVEKLLKRGFATLKDPLTSGYEASEFAVNIDSKVSVHALRRGEIAEKPLEELCRVFRWCVMRPGKGGSLLEPRRISDYITAFSAVTYIVAETDNYHGIDLQLTIPAGTSKASFEILMAGVKRMGEAWEKSNNPLWELRARARQEVGELLVEGKVWGASSRYVVFSVRRFLQAVYEHHFS